MFPQIIVSKLISKDFASSPAKIVGIIAIFEHEHEILFYLAEFLSFQIS